jgi:hypothetical protein
MSKEHHRLNKIRYSPSSKDRIKATLKHTDDHSLLKSQGVHYFISECVEDVCALSQQRKAE